MNVRRLLIVIATTTGCDLGDPGAPTGPLGGSAAPGADAAPSAGVPPQPGTTVTDVPCDVAGVLASKCTSCHGRPPSNGAPMAMLTYEDLTAPSRSDGAKTVAALALERMKSAARPMPPSGASASDIAVLEAWVAAGLPRGTCAAPPEGTTGTYDTPPVCTSGTYWSGGNSESPFMHPGAACIGCHRGGEGSLFTAAGTVFPTAHEPNECNGVAGGITVVITDANGAVFALPVNAAGNFFTQAALALPYRARLVAGSKVREMVTPQTSGDCNHCHSERGTQGAPGRVMAP